jgi:hypothetical protein
MEWSIKRVKVDDQSHLPITLENARSELDTRVDTIFAGLNCHLIHYTGQECTVSGFHNKLGASACRASLPEPVPLPVPVPLPEPIPLPKPIPL